MSNPIAVIGTSWPNIRVALYRRNDGFYQFFEEHWRCDDNSDYHWVSLGKSGIYDNCELARCDMIPFAQNIEET